MMAKCERLFFSMISANRIRIAGAVVLVVGLLAAAVIYHKTQPNGESGIPGVDVRTKRDNLQLEKMGESYILLTDINDWFAGLWRGRRLTYTFGVLAITGFLGCYWFADLLAHSSASDDHTRDGNA